MSNETTTAFEVAQGYVKTYLSELREMEERRKNFIAAAPTNDLTEARARMWLELAKAEQMKRLADVLELVASKLVPPTLDYEAMGINPEELQL